MGRIIAIYGVISGVIVVLGMYTSMAVVSDHGSIGMVAGYLSMLVALSFVFVGVKRYRDVNLGGTITFGKAFVTGLGIALVSSLFYVLSWEVYNAATGGTFITQYVASQVEAMRAAGKSAAEITKFSNEMNAFAEQYKNPLIRMSYTFMEISPVALLMPLISAALLRNSRFLPAVQPRT